jgi:hypothetical protein
MTGPVRFDLYRIVHQKKARENSPMNARWNHYNRPEPIDGFADQLYPHPQIFLARGEGHILVAIFPPLVAGERNDTSDRKEMDAWRL